MGLFDLSGFDTQTNLSLDFMESFLQELNEGYTELISSGDMTEEELTESTALTRNIHELNKKKKDIEEKLSLLDKKKIKYRDDKTKISMINKSMNKLYSQLDDIDNRLGKLTRDERDESLDTINRGKEIAEAKKKTDNNYVNTQIQNATKAKSILKSKHNMKPAKNKREPGSIKKLADELKKITESLNEVDTTVNEVLEEDVSIPVPGGEKAGSAHKEVSVSIPKGSEITVTAYTDAMAQLKKSMQESFNMMEQMANLKIIQESAEESVEEKNIAFAEEAMDQALLEAYESGPIFESVDRDDKDSVKSIVKKIRPELKSFLASHSVRFYEPRLFIRLLMSSTVGGAPFVGTNIGDGTTSKSRGGLTNWWTTRFWQVLGAINCEKTDIKDVINYIEEKYKEDLGDYKVLYVKMTPTLIDIFANKFNWKNTKGTYFILIDKSLSKELKKALSEIKVKDDKGEVKTESCECGSSDSKKSDSKKKKEDDEDDELEESTNSDLLDMDVD